MFPQLGLILPGLSLLVVGFVIRRKQSQAATCPRHNHRAGQAAQYLRLLCNVTGCLLLVLAILMMLD